MSTMPDPMQAPDPDEAKCQRVFLAMQKVMETQGVDISWMSGELGNHLNSALYAGRTGLMMQLLKRGIPKAEAEEGAAQQMGLVALELGMLIGQEMAGADVLRDMLGDDFGKDFT